MFKSLGTVEVLYEPHNHGVQPDLLEVQSCLGRRIRGFEPPKRGAPRFPELTVLLESGLSCCIAGQILPDRDGDQRGTLLSNHAIVQRLKGADEKDE